MSRDLAVARSRRIERARVAEVAARGPATPTIDRLARDRAVGQQRRRADRVAGGQHAGAGQRLRAPGADALAGQRLLAWACGPSRSMCASTIAPTAATISSADVSSKANRYLVNSSSAIELTLRAVGVRRVEVGRLDALERAADRQRDEQREADAEQRRGPALPAQRLDDRVGRVAADEHQHEQEQDHDRAGVDDDLHQAEERALLDHVERAEAHHRGDERERRVDRVAEQHHADARRPARSGRGSRTRSPRPAAPGR